MSQFYQSCYLPTVTNPAIKLEVMKVHFQISIHYILFVAILAASCKTVNNTTSNSTNIKGYQLVWSDEFNGNAVDTTDWNFEIGGEGWGNHEQEYYQFANATVSGDNLIITGRKEDVQSNHYTSSRMTTKGKREFMYGKIEARIKIPVGQGFWPAF